MCLAAIALDAHPRFPLVVASNRDEYFHRPAEPLSWWSPSAGGPAVLAGRDMQEGGTWLGLTAAGRFALLTNVRRPGGKQDAAPSRGAIVPRWLRGDLDPDGFQATVAAAGYNPFNVIAGNFRRSECFWFASDAGRSQRLEPGLHGLSNAALDTPWPKVELLKARVGSALAGAESSSALAASLFTALGDRTVAADAMLPATGIPLAWERQLSPAFIVSDDGRYGTRCSTLVITERTRAGVETHVIERTYEAAGGPPARVRHAVLRGWPPGGFDDVDASGLHHAPVRDVA